MDDRAGGDWCGPEVEAPAKEAPAGPALEGEKVTKAKAWAEKSEIGSEAVVQLQELLGIQQSGAYDEATIQAVYRLQVKENEGKKFTKKENGIADESFFRRHGLIFTHKIDAASAMPEFVKAMLNEDGSPKSGFENGITIGIYTHYEEQSVKNKTFGQKARGWAKYNQAIGLNDQGELEMGKPVPVTEVGQVIEVVQGISKGLQQLALESATLGWGGDFDPNKPPAWTQVKDLGLFAHGMPYGLAMDANKDKQYKHGLISDAPDSYSNTAPNIASFAAGLDGALLSDVNVQLFACNAGRDYDAEDPFAKPTNKDRKRPDGQEMGSENSFAYKLAEELGEDASVFGHLTEGHTTDNFTSLAYGKAAGGATSKHMFNILYPDSFIDSEMQRLFPNETAEQQALLRPKLRNEMWEHYKSSISDEHFRQAGRTEVRHWDQPKPTPEQIKKGEKPPVRMRQLGDRLYEKGIPDLGAHMLTNPEECKELMNENFQEVWMTKERTASLR